MSFLVFGLLLLLTGCNLGWHAIIPLLSPLVTKLFLRVVTVCTKYHREGIYRIFIAVSSRSCPFLSVLLHLFGLQLLDQLMKHWVAFIAMYLQCRPQMLGSRLKNDRFVLTALVSFSK